MTEQSTPKMTHNEMIDVLKGLVFGTFDRTTAKEREALDMAISALTEELSEDGTLTVHVADGSKVSRVFVKGDNIFGGLYYPDSAENKGEPKRGHWIATPECDTCSECHFIVVAGFNFCPHCGADMRGE